METGYSKLHKQGLLAARAAAALACLDECRMCPRQCGVNRTANLAGICKVGRQARVASWHPHFGEETPLVGRYGSGTIFFSHCCLLCRFCQNYEISAVGEGYEVESTELAAIMIDLQNQGCHNINLVTPSHVVPQIVEAVSLAARQGLRVPLVYNCGGYECLETLQLLDGIIDIYMPDFKFWDNAWAERYCQAADYRERACAAVREMHRQVGDLQINSYGVATRGLLVRHLVMPGRVGGTGEIMRFLARDVSRATYVNIMAQYHPCGDAEKDPVIGRRPTAAEFAEAMTAAQMAGITRIDH